MIKLKDLLENNQASEVKILLEKMVKFYKSNSEIVDHIYLEQSLSNRYAKNLSFVENKDNKVIKIK